MLNAYTKFYKTEKKHEIMLNRFIIIIIIINEFHRDASLKENFSWSFITWKPPIETWAQEIKGARKWTRGPRELNSSPTLEIIL